MCICNTACSSACVSRYNARAALAGWKTCIADPEFTCTDDTAIKGIANLKLESGETSGVGYAFENCKKECVGNPRCNIIVFSDDITREIGDVDLVGGGGSCGRALRTVVCQDLHRRHREIAKNGQVPGYGPRFLHHQYCKRGPTLQKTNFTMSAEKPYTDLCTHVFLCNSF